MSTVPGPRAVPAATHAHNDHLFPIMQQNHRLDIQGLRAIAVVAVVLYHAGDLLPGGYLGVDLFFVLSGYVITASLVREARTHGKVSVPRFVVRRIYRLLPAFVAFTLFTSLAAIILWPVVLLPEIGAAAFAAATLRANLFFYTQGDYFDPSAHLNPFLHTWSLSVEEQFYLLWPWFVVVAGAVAARSDRRGLSLNHVLFGITNVVGAVSFALFVGWEALEPLKSAIVAPARFVFFSPVTRAWEFCAGSLLVLISQRGPGRVQGYRLVQVAGFVGLAASFLLGGVEEDTTALSFLPVITTVLSTVALLAAPDPAGAGGLTRLLSTRALVWTGDRSYGWYLWHWPAIAALNMLGITSRVPLISVGLLSLLPAAACYRWIEEPWRRRGKVAGGMAAFRVLCVSVLLGGGVALLANTALEGAPSIGIDGAPLVVRAQKKTLDRLSGCDLQPGEPSRLKAACEFRVDDPKGDIWLIGDSHAGAISDAVVAAGNASHLNVRVVVRSGCPVSAVERAGHMDCYQHYRWLMAALETARPELVILSQRSVGYAGEVAAGLGSVFCPHDADHRICSSVDPFFSGLHAALSTMKEVGVDVLYVRSPPEYERAPIDCVRAYGSSCPPTLARGYSDGLRTRIDAGLMGTLERHQPLRMIDPFDAFCDSAACLVMTDDRFLYRDSHHLSVDGAAILRPIIERHLEECF